MAGDGFSPGWYGIEVMSQAGPPVSVEFRIRRDSVEVWFQDRCQAVLDRDLFGNWLQQDLGPYAVDDVLWMLTEDNHVALIIRDCGGWHLPLPLLTGLRERVLRRF
jgi:hypothetical protein